MATWKVTAIPREQNAGQRIVRLIEADTRAEANFFFTQEVGFDGFATISKIERILE